ncbi:phosphatidylinositol 3-related kinase, putative [Leishmania donovani]|uniref:Serine/threonine-protein kinase ATR n=1 Tax=Leishmania donovani TaxID=5661 RepID=E9BNQ5_LEIDO|nr:phosphatidylinositol 3-related kinase, putative [Leishmania donovani]CBZ36883.1 phosphatidylinositol 3-related kinase, putative [Leishmania donovani]
MEAVIDDEGLEPAAVRQRTERGVWSPSNNSRHDSAGIRDELAGIGEQIKTLQFQLSSNLSPETKVSEVVTQTLWDLLWRLRTFLFLASPSAAHQWRIGGALFNVYCRRHYGRDAAHVAIALRLYLVLLRFTAVCPAAALHGCLTLFGVLAVLNDPRLRPWKDTSERLLEGFLFVSRALHRSENNVFAQLINVAFELLSEVTAHFNGSAAETESALFLQLSVEPAAELLSQTEGSLPPSASPKSASGAESRARRLQELFSTCTCVETLYEARCIQVCLLRLVVRLSEERLLLSLSPDRVGLLCDVACHLVSSAVPGAEGGVVNRVQHDAAWHTLRHFAVVDRRLLPHIQGPLILSVLAAQWSRRGAQTCSSIFNITVAEKALFDWCRRLSTEELDSLVVAAYHRGGVGPDGQDAMTECLAQMWEVGVQWCADLYTSPSTAVDGIVANTASCSASSVSAMVTLQQWVWLCERVFRSTVAQRSAFAGLTRMGEPKLLAAYDHQLQLLVSELPLSSLTASLLCTQLPSFAVESELAFLPSRILSFFNGQALIACVAEVVDRAKNCIDVSAYRLLEANALAVQSRLKVSSSVVQCDAAAFQSALAETLQVMQHHDAPSYSLLVQAIIVLVHAFPVDSENGEVRKSDTVARVMQALDNSISSRHNGSYAALEVAAPLWHMLDRETAATLFRAGSGLGWTRRLLALPPQTATSATTAELFLCRAAGLAEALQHALEETMLRDGASTSRSTSHSPAPKALPGAVAARGQMPGRLRRVYESIASHFPVVVQLLQTLGALLTTLQRDAQWWRCMRNGKGGTYAEASGAIVALGNFFRHATSILVLLLDAKYRFAVIAGSEAGKGCNGALAGAAPICERSSTTKQPLAQAATVVDVDDDDNADGVFEENEEAKKPHRHRKATASGATLSSKTGKASAKAAVGGAPQASNLSQQSIAKTKQLEKIVQLNRSKLLPALLAFTRRFVYEGKGRGASPDADEVQNEDGRSSQRAAGSVRNHASALECALLSLAYTSLALSPPFSLNDVNELFSLASVGAYNVKDSILYCALRELVLWSPQLACRECEAGDSAMPTLLLVRLSGTEQLLSTVLSARRDGNTTYIAECGAQILQLLWFGRRFFQRAGDTRAEAADKPEREQRLSLTDASAAVQEDCMAASERVTQEGYAWLCLCFDLYAVYHSVRPAHNDTALAVMGLCVETARGVMAVFSWSATDLLRFRERPFVFSSFFKAIVDKEDRDMKVILTSSLDVLGRYVISAGVDQAGGGTVAATATMSTVVPGDGVTRAKLKHLMDQEKIADWRAAAGALAYALYAYGGKPAAKQMLYLAEAASYAKKSIQDVPSMVRSTIHFVAFHIVSLEADAQMLAYDRRCHSGRDHRRCLSGAAAVHAPLAVVGGSAHSLFVCDRSEGGDGAEAVGVEDASASPPERTTTGELHAAEGDGGDASASKEVLDGIAFSVFERALEQLVTLGEAAETASAVENSLRKPVVRAVAAEELRKNMFAVLDAVYKAIRIEPAVACRSEGADATDKEEASAAPPVSLRTRRRWLLGLASFIRFMGPQTTPIALMLPTLLGHCARFPSLLPSVCIVWRELICACTDEYLAESAAAIVLSLVSLEQQAALESESKGLLLCALRHLYTRTEAAEFWDSYKVVLGTFSELVRATLHSRHSGCAEAAERSEESRRDSAHVLLLGFASVMRSGSLQSSTVFVRALYQYLCAADEATRRQLSHAAADHPEVLQTLLRCTEADADSALYAMRCISILGAVAAPNAAASTGARWATKTADDERRSSLALSSASALDAWNRMTWTQSFYLDAETVLNWRKFSFTLLRDYFPRVFASTADPVLHNCIAFAVQELIRASTRQERLQHKGVELRREDIVHVDELDRYIWWMRLTPHVKQLLGGFTTTRYSLTVNWQTRLRSPEYTPSLEYRRWLFAFFNHLVMSCEGWFAEMVQPLRNVAKKNASLVLYLLPYLVVHILESGKVEDVQYIEHEVKAVLEAAAGGPNVAVLSLRSQSIYEASPETLSQEEPREHAHTVLSLLEDVEQLRWTLLRNRGRVTCVFEPQEQTESLCIRLAEMYGDFLRGIPWPLRCRAALRIGSHIRALRSVESQRRIPGLASVIAAVPLQRIFAALKDRESSRSIHRASPGLSLEDTAFSFENNGDWLSALGSSELVLQHRPHSGQHQLTALHCMNELGELYMTSRYAASLLASASVSDSDVRGFEAKEYLSGAALKGRSTFSQMVSEAPGGAAAVSDFAQLRHHVQAYANEAAWRLGQWDTLLPSSTAASAATAPVNSGMPTVGSDGGRSVSLAMPAAYLQRALSGNGSLAFVRCVTDKERAKVVPLVRTPCQEDLTAQGYTVTLLLHALGDVDAVSELCARAFITNGSGHHCCGDGSDASQSSAPMMKLAAPLLPSSVKEEIASLLSRRESYVEDTIAAREPLLALHRLIYRELDMPQKVAETWLKQSELLRNGGLGEAALTAARQAAFECREHVTATSYYVLVANLLHDTQSPTPAMEFARECVADARIPATTRAQLQILLTNWLIETGSERPEHIFAEYEKARELDRKSELVHHQMALFYDHLHTLASNASEGAAAQLTAAATSPTSSSTANVSAAVMYNAALQHQKEMVDSIQRCATRAIVHFGEALLRGVEKASVSLPRMLTLWLDSAVFLGGLMGTTVGKLDGTTSAVLGEMNNRIREFVLSTVRPVIPPAVVMTALPQLLSRLGHPVTAVRNVLTDIVLHLMDHFPQQCLWLVLPMALSKEGPKEVVETQIIKPFADNPRNERVLRHAKILCDTLLTICNCSASLFPKEKGLTQLSPVQKITPMLATAKFIVPVLSNLTPDIRASSSEDVFPTAPCFDHFDDRVVVMRSLQKPKRIWVHTNDGREMSFLCKAKDEPRKDIRMMEVAALMNSFFLSDPEAKRKRFSLRRYAITALSDDCAVIEWLNDTTPLAKVAMECYALDRSGVHISSVKKWMALVDEKKMSKMELFTKYILPEAPPVMHQWLDRTFASNQSWYEARTLFTQSTALWSIAGHIVGLGDRHAENLMIDMERGELMHVDFACMFDKGEKLEVPEQVRFRLTQNLTDVMGVLGAYGPFQATCEVALRCEMKNKSAVMSIIETLLHEPLMEWRRQSSRSHSSNGPKQLMERVARRLDGFLDLYSVPAQRDTLSLNVESQVAKLIHHSSDLNNLSQMYIWWMAWI